MTHLVTITHTLNNVTDRLIPGKLEMNRHGVTGGRIVSGTLRKQGKGSNYTPVDFKIAVAGLTDAEIETITEDWGAVVEPMPEVSAEAVTEPATARQIGYLRALGYTGTALISKAEASRKIDTLKGSRTRQEVLTRADVDDFTTWVEGVGYVR